MRILVVDGHRLIRHAIAHVLQQGLAEAQVTQAESGQAALAAYGECRPEVVLLEVGLTDVSGLEVTRRLRRRWPGARVLFLSQHDDLGVVRHALAVGALGFLSKHCAPSELMEAVQEVAAGRPYIEHAVATRLAMHQERALGHRLGDMTQRELEVLLLYARGEAIPGIARRLCVSPKTVSNYLALLKHKLQVATTIELVHLAVDAGLVRFGRPGLREPA